MGKNKKKELQKLVQDLTGFLIVNEDGKVEALDVANKAAVVLADAANDPNVTTVVTTDAAAVPKRYAAEPAPCRVNKNLMHYNTAMHKVVPKEVDVYDTRTYRIIPKHLSTYNPTASKVISKHLSPYNPAKEKVVAKGLGTHDSRIERPVPNNLETYNPETHRPMAKYLKGYNPESDALISKDDQNRYRAAVWRLRQASAASNTRSGQLASEVLDLLGETPIKPTFDYLEGPGWRELDKRAKELVSQQPVSQGEKTAPAPRRGTRPLFDSRPDFMVHEVTGELAVWSPEAWPGGPTSPQVGGWVIGQFNSHGNWLRHSFIPADGEHDGFRPLRRQDLITFADVIDIKSDPNLPKNAVADVADPDLEKQIQDDVLRKMMKKGPQFIPHTTQEPLSAGEHRELLKQNNELLTKVLAALEAPKDKR